MYPAEGCQHLDVMQRDMSRKGMTTCAYVSIIRNCEMETLFIPSKRGG